MWRGLRCGAPRSRRDESRCRWKLKSLRILRAGIDPADSARAAHTHTQARKRTWKFHDARCQSLNNYAEIVASSIIKLKFLSHFKHLVSLALVPVKIQPSPHDWSPCCLKFRLLSLQLQCSGSLREVTPDQNTKGKNSPKRVFKTVFHFTITKEQ